MATKRLKTVSSVGRLRQRGSGTPDHVAPARTMYIDVTTGIEYVRTASGTWEPSSEAIAFHTGDGINTFEFETGLGNNVQLGQELFNCVYNNTGSPVANGTPVKRGAYNATYKCPNLVVAKASDLSLSEWDGILTADADGSPVIETPYTSFGLVRNIDATTFNEGDLIWLAENGGLTNVKPSAPNYIRYIGKIQNKVGNTADLYVGIGYSNIDAEQIFKDTGEPNGFPDKTLVSLSYDVETRSLSVSGTFYYYNKSIKYIKRAVSEVLAHTNTTGTYFYYYVNEVLTVSTTFFDLQNVTPVAVILYNNTAATTFWAGPSGILVCERHGCVMDWATHKELHQSIGCYAESGFALNGTYSVATGSGTLAENSFGIDTGVVKDEDNETNVPTLTDSAGVGNKYWIYYRQGSEWRWFQNNIHYLISTNILYNPITAGSGALTQVTSNGTYMNIYAIGMPVLTTGMGFGFIVGQTTYNSLALAQAETIYSLDLSGFPASEVAPLYQITMRREVAYDDTGGNTRIESIKRIVGTKFVSGTSGTSPSVHNNLSGRADADAHPSTAISYALPNASTVTLQTLLDNDNAYASVTYGETIAKGDNLYLGTDSKVYKASAASSLTMSVVFKAVTAGVANDIGVALRRGVFTYDTPHGLSPVGSLTKMYASTTAGLTTMSAPGASGNIIQSLGYVQSTTQVFFIPSLDTIEVA